VIQKVSFRNYKAYRSLDLELERFTVLVGPNASGKTTLLRGLELVSDVATKTLSRPRFVDFVKRDEPALKSYGSNSPLELRIAGKWNGTDGSLRVAEDRRIDFDDLTREVDALTISGQWGGQLLVEPVNSSALSRARQSFGAALSSTAVLRLEPRLLAEAAYSEEAVPEIKSDGSGLAAVLAYLKLERDEVFEEIQLALKQLVPMVRRIRIERAAVERTALRTISLDEQSHQVSEKRTLWGYKVVLDMRGAKGVAADAAGEGTIMALGLLTVLMGPTKPQLILLDDIELGLHPTAQGKLIEVLRKIQERDPELQIIATSHSPFILNYLDPKEVRMTFLAENGFARCEKLTAHPEFEQWKDLMSPGEFWSTVGESWLEKSGETASHE
jgi:ABC-type branched-subunit amino acid transport system ATPase component